jgi:multidrug transporter EmrE-like cation transporter
MRWWILVAGILSNASASALLKLASTPPHAFPTLAQPMSVLHNLPLLAGAALYVVAFGCYAWALSTFPLNLAHPVMTAGTIALVAGVSYVGFGEEFAWTTIAGLALILAGIVLVSVRMR